VLVPGGRGGRAEEGGPAEEEEEWGGGKAGSGKEARLLPPRMLSEGLTEKDIKSAVAFVCGCGWCVSVCWETDLKQGRRGGGEGVINSAGKKSCKEAVGVIRAKQEAQGSSKKRLACLLLLVRPRPSPLQASPCVFTQALTDPNDPISTTTHLQRTFSKLIMAALPVAGMVFSARRVPLLALLLILLKSSTSTSTSSSSSSSSSYSDPTPPSWGPTFSVSYLATVIPPSLPSLPPSLRPSVPPSLPPTLPPSHPQPHQDPAPFGTVSPLPLPYKGTWSYH
jgi:hypothetical protein